MSTASSYVVPDILALFEAGLGLYQLLERGKLGDEKCSLSFSSFLFLVITNTAPRKHLQDA